MDAVLDEQLRLEALGALVAPFSGAQLEFLLTPLPALLAFEELLVGGHVARLAAVEAVVEAEVDIDGEAFLAGVVLPRLGAEGALDAHLAAGGGVDGDAVGFKIA